MSLALLCPACGHPLHVTQTVVGPRAYPDAICLNTMCARYNIVPATAPSERARERDPF